MKSLMRNYAYWKNMDIIDYRLIENKVKHAVNVH